MGNIFCDLRLVLRYDINSRIHEEKKKSDKLIFIKTKLILQDRVKRMQRKDTG